MHTNHKIIYSDSRELRGIEDDSIDLVVTSPPYPMIQMWDELFCSLNQGIREYLARFDGKTAFNLMHCELDKVWRECERVLKPHGFMCINIGDATRSMGDSFNLYSNHSRITSFVTSLSFESLPIILWRKSTNAPNKFMGSGMLPAGAYVTLEHEYILIFRKGGKREFRKPAEKKLRNESALFWEERNTLYSDSWDVKSVRQELNDTELRKRSAAYPFELPYRLIAMYSVKGDTVLDPFLGTGTTLFSAIAAGRDSIGVELDDTFRNLILSALERVIAVCNNRIKERYENHLDFIREYQVKKKGAGYQNANHGFPVVTRQETDIKMEYVKNLIIEEPDSYRAEYHMLEAGKNNPDGVRFRNEADNKRETQLSLF